MRDLGINLLVALVSLILVTAAIEGGCRLAGFRPEPRFNPVFSWKTEGELWRMKPGSSWHTRAGGHLVQVNSHGLRDREIGPCRADVFRILLLGDSVTFGHGQPIDVTVGRELERVLSNQTRTVEVINAGVPGWSTYQQRLFYEEAGLALCPDLVLVGFVLNDVTELQRGMIEIGTERGLMLTRAISVLAEHTATGAGLKWLYETTINPAQREIGVVKNLVQHADAPEVRHAMELAMQELARLRDLAAERGDAFGLILFPFRFQLGADGLDAPQVALARFAAAQGIPVFDTLPVLRPHPPARVLMDHDHFTADGHRIVARAVAAWLEATSLLDR